MKLIAKTIYIACMLIAFLGSPLAYSLDNVSEINAPSAAMKRDIPAIVVLPSSYQTDAQMRYPVVYLLHGYGGNYKSWLQIKPDLQKLASRYNMIIVCPDGAKRSWYWDSPTDPTMQFETYISKELVAHIDANYRTLPNRDFRAITGLSMGGHGGLWLGIRHPDTFGACGATSGGVDIRPFPNSWEMWRALGARQQNEAIWNEHTVATQLQKIEPSRTAIIIDCGYDDFFYTVNKKLHQELEYLNIPHDFIVRPGRHDAKYWENSIEYQLLFFARNFENNMASKKN